MNRTTYTVSAKRWAHGWELHIAGIGVTQSHGLADAETMVRDYIALDLGVAPDSFDVRITPELPRDVKADLTVARKAKTRAEVAGAQLRTHGRAAARKLRQAGWTGKDIAEVMDLSPQRVSQLLKGDD